MTREPRISLYKKTGETESYLWQQQRSPIRATSAYISKGDFASKPWEQAQHLCRADTQIRRHVEKWKTRTDRVVMSHTRLEAPIAWRSELADIVINEDLLLFDRV